MSAAQKLSLLESQADSLGAKVSYEPMAGVTAGSGGLCRVRGEYRVIIDRRLKAPERIQILETAIAKMSRSKAEPLDGR